MFMATSTAMFYAIYIAFILDFVMDLGNLVVNYNTTHSNVLKEYLATHTAQIIHIAHMWKKRQRHTTHAYIIYGRL